MPGVSAYGGSASRMAISRLGLSPAAAADGGEAGRRAAGRRGLAVRAQMGRLPLPRLPRRRRRSRCSPSRASRSAATFPEVVGDARARCRRDRFVLDGELIIPVGGALSFDALQMRLHPAESRIRKLAARDAGAADAVRLPGRRRARALLDAPLTERRAALEALHARPATPVAAALALHRATARVAQALARPAPAARSTASSPSACDGPTSRASGRCSRSSSCAPPTASSAASATRPRRRQVGSLLLGLYDEDGLLDHVGFTSAIPADANGRR